MTTRRPMVFALPEHQAIALRDLATSFEPFMTRNHPAQKAADALDEQMAAQNRRWERCDECAGSGWIEGKK